MSEKIQTWAEENLFASTNGPACRPQLSANLESNIPGLLFVGDLVCAPVIKLAMEQGYNVVEHIASLPRPEEADGNTIDLIVIGAGASGLNAALAARDKGLSCLVLEKEKLANTIGIFHEGQWVYAEPDIVPPKGKLWLDDAKKEDLVKR